MKKVIQFSLLIILLSFSLGYSALATDSLKLVKAIQPHADADNAGLKLPAGFGAIKVADNLGRARNIAVTSQGDIYVKINGKVASDKGILVLHDNNADGKADQITGLGNFGGIILTILLKD